MEGKKLSLSHIPILSFLQEAQNLSTLQLGRERLRRDYSEVIRVVALAETEWIETGMTPGAEKEEAHHLAPEISDKMWREG